MNLNNLLLHCLPFYVLWWKFNVFGVSTAQLFCGQMKDYWLVENLKSCLPYREFGLGEIDDFFLSYSHLYYGAYY